MGGANNEGGSDEDKDVLLIGSQTHILAYDVDRNMDLFYNEVNNALHACINLLRLFCIIHSCNYYGCC